MFRRNFLGSMMFGLSFGKLASPEISLREDKTLRELLEESELLRFWNTEIYYDVDKTTYDNICKRIGLNKNGIPFFTPKEGLSTYGLYSYYCTQVNACVIAQCRDKRLLSMEKIRSFLLIRGNEIAICVTDTDAMDEVRDKTI